MYETDRLWITRSEFRTGMAKLEWNTNMCVMIKSINYEVAYIPETTGWEGGRLLF